MTCENVWLLVVLLRLIVMSHNNYVFTSMERVKLIIVAYEHHGGSFDSFNRRCACASPSNL